MGDSNGGDSTRVQRAVLARTLNVMLTAEQVAARLGQQRGFVYKLAGRGEIPGATKLGARWVFRAWEFECWRLGLWDPAAETWVEWADRNRVDVDGAPPA